MPIYDRFKLMYKGVVETAKAACVLCVVIAGFVYYVWSENYFFVL